MAEVSVPCECCHRPIHFGLERCPACASLVSNDLRAALEERLDATSSEFRMMKSRLREAAILVFVLGALRLVFSTFLYVSSDDGIDDPVRALERILLAIDWTVGVALIVASRFVEKRPRATIMAVVGIWLAVQCLMAMIAPLTLAQAILVNVFVIAVLARGFIAARDAENIRRTLTSTSVRTVT